jgi:hypothetical protein
MSGAIYQSAHSDPEGVLVEGRVVDQLTFWQEAAEQ